MRSDEIRKRFLDFFETKDHKIFESDLLVPRNDPSVLFTGAGMNQFKEEFMGRNVESRRAASCQKCLRTGDIENVGQTPRHHTFFEMLGNFSFGDYFKSEAIQWAWEFLTNHLNVDKKRLWFSVYEQDDEAYRIWSEKIGVPEQRIFRLGPKDNFWPADAPAKGPDGPCGPCSEIFYDRGEQYGCGSAECNVACDCGRFVEIWNLVFTEYDRGPGGHLKPLPNKNIDTGMGLERIASVIQGVDTNFETDLISPLVQKARELVDDSVKNNVTRINLIADHVRAVVFAISDGVAPSNEKRGYVVRKLIRRAYLAGERSGAFLFQMVPTLVRLMQAVYPELDEKREHIAAVLRQEEEKFANTLSEALPLLEEKLSSCVNSLSGKDVFDLVDTYGLPIDVITKKAREAGKVADLDAFEHHMEKRREESRCGSGFSDGGIFQSDIFEEAPAGPLSDEMPLHARVTFMVRCGKQTEVIEKGQTGEIVVSPQSSVFYAESGGQVGDKGRIVSSGGEIEIINTFKAGDKKVFSIEVKKGQLRSGEEVTLYDDTDRKRLIAANHSATHLLQASLREVLGEHVKQSGSSVDEDRLRFDFTHTEKLSQKQILRVEDLVNQWISSAVDVCKEVTSLEDAEKSGAISLFGEKYGEEVRVITMGELSKELCGGSHVDNTKEIGAFKITSESSVASGVRRMEALTGRKAVEWVKGSIEQELENIRGIIPEEELPKDELISEAQKVLSGDYEINNDTVHDISLRVIPGLYNIRCRREKKSKKLEKKRKAREFDLLREELDRLVLTPEIVSGIKTYMRCFDDVDMNVLRRAASYFEKKAESGVVVLAGKGAGKAHLVCAVTEDLVASGISARELLNIGSGAISGGGGGRESFAQAGGRSPEGIQKAIDQIKNAIASRGNDEES